MNKWYLIMAFAALLAIALALIIYPLRKQGMMTVIFLPLVLLAAALGYRQWGAWPVWQTYLAEQTKQEEIKRVLAEIKSPEELIERLKSRLDNSPASARGWYLLGRLYVSQNALLKAQEAFAKACKLNPADETAQVNYIETRWQLNDQKFDQSLRTDLQALLQKNPDQPDALAMLAMDAYQQNNFLHAIELWQHLLRLAPENSPEAKSLRKAIAMAQQKQEVDAAQ